MKDHVILAKWQPILFGCCWFYMANANFTWTRFHVISEMRITQYRANFTWIMYHVKLEIHIYCQFYMSWASCNIGIMILVASSCISDSTHVIWTARFWTKKISLSEQKNKEFWTKKKWTKKPLIQFYTTRISCNFNIIWWPGMYYQNYGFADISCYRLSHKNWHSPLFEQKMTFALRDRHDPSSQI